MSPRPDAINPPRTEVETTGGGFKTSTSPAMIISAKTVGKNSDTFLDVPTNQAKLSSMAQTSIASVAKRTSFVSSLTTTKRKLYLRSVTPTFSFSKMKPNLNASNDAPPSNSYTKSTHTPNLTNVSTSLFAESNQTLNLKCFNIDGRGSERLGGSKNISWGENSFPSPWGGTKSLGLGGE